MAEENKGNPDSHGLGWWGDERSFVGYIDEVNGPGSVEVPDYKPTRHELIQLAKYWAGIAIDIEYDWFEYQQTGSSEIRLGPFAHRRISRISDVLGQEEVAKAVDEACDEFGKSCDPRTWKIFREGNPEEQRALQAKIAREMSGTEDAEEVAKITDFMTSLGLEVLLTECGKTARFAILPFPAASVSDPSCIIVPILHYVNADADGRYIKDDNGSVPPIEWEIRHLGLSRFEMKCIQKMIEPGEAAADIDIVMTRPAAASGREFHRISKKSRWRLNPALVLDVETHWLNASNTLAAKIAGRQGVTMFENFQSASTAIE